MGEAILSAIIERGLASPAEITVSDVNDARRQYLTQKHGVRATGDNRSAADDGEVVVLAIKPQNLEEVMADLKGQLRSAHLVLSIVAGARIGTLRRGLEHNAIVRTMPNTPAQVGEGITVWTATAAVTAQQKEWAGAILRVIGQEMYVEDEKYLDMATAVSGSGPAYFFLFMETLIEAAVSIGLSRDAAEKLVLQTMVGSGQLLKKSGKSPAELRRMVTSPGGTTAAALAEFEKGGLAELVKQAVAAALKRARELGGGETG